MPRNPRNHTGRARNDRLVGRLTQPTFLGQSSPCEETCAECWGETGVIVILSPTSIARAAPRSGQAFRPAKARPQGDKDGGEAHPPELLDMGGPGAFSRSSGAEARIHKDSLNAALKRCSTQKLTRDNAPPPKSRANLEACQTRVFGRPAGASRGAPGSFDSRKEHPSLRMTKGRVVPALTSGSGGGGRRGSFDSQKGGLAQNDKEDGTYWGG